jgi:hypothetical protein
MAITFRVTGASYRVGIGGRVDADRETETREAEMTEAAALVIALQLVFLSAALTLPTKLWIGQPF